MASTEHKLPLSTRADFIALPPDPSKVTEAQRRWAFPRIESVCVRIAQSFISPAPSPDPVKECKAGEPLVRSVARPTTATHPTAPLTASSGVGELSRPVARPDSTLQPLRRTGTEGR